MGWNGLEWVGMIWYDDEDGLVAPPVSIKDRSLFGHAFSH